MKKAVYEAPVTERFSVELEGSFCGSVEMEDENKKGPSVSSHEVNTDFKVIGFENDSWE